MPVLHCPAAGREIAIDLEQRHRERKHEARRRLGELQVSATAFHERRVGFLRIVDVVAEVVDEWLSAQHAAAGNPGDLIALRLALLSCPYRSQ